MMRKGVYSATIALTALVIAVAIIASTSQRLSAQGESIYPNAIIEVKGHWQNARYVLDKAASDAIADSVLNNGCSYDSSKAQSTVTSYLSRALAAMWGGDECIVSIDNFGGPADNIVIETTISCTKYFGEKFSASYEKGAIFEKAVSGNNSAGGCLVDVKDLQSGICEVDGIPSGNPDDLCFA